ncbi:MAG: hypothetical protein ACXACI_07165 [Candidatus Hodarchaeales archaeon]|jgi:hypothetical protein
MNPQAEQMDFETLFRTLHQLKMKIDGRLKWWSTLRWLFFLTPIVILVLTLPIGLDLNDDFNLYLVIMISLLWLFFIILNLFFYSMRRNQTKMLFLFAVGKGDENIPGMDWEFLKLRTQTRKGLLLLLVSIITFIVFISGNAIVSIFSESIDSELKPFFGAVGGFLIFISLGLIIYYLDFFLNMSEIRGDYYPPGIERIHSRLGILDFIEGYLRPSAREDFRYFRNAMTRTAGSEGELFFGQFIGLLYLYSKQIIVENWGQPKFALNYQQLIENISQVFPRETFMENLPLFINVMEKRLRIDLAARLTSLQRLGSLKDEQLQELVIPLLQLEQDGEMLQAFQNVLHYPAVDRLLGAMFSEISHDRHALQCFCATDSVIRLNDKGALRLLMANNTSQERSFQVNVSCPGLNPDTFVFTMHIAKGEFLDQLLPNEAKDVFFTTKSGKGLRAALGISLVNSQGFWLELQPQNVGKYALKVTINDTETGELVSSYQTAILVKRDLVDHLKVLLGLGSIVAGPLVSAVQFFVI